MTQVELDAVRAMAVNTVQNLLRKQSFVMQEIDQALKQARADAFDQRDRALFTELVYGVIRTEVALAQRLQPFFKKSQPDPQTYATLLVAAYQLLALEKIPDYAAVNTAVDLARAARGDAGAGFVNAVLRGLLRQLSEEGISIAERRRLLILGSCPEWLKERLTAACGAEEAEALLCPDEEEFGLDLRLRREASEERLSALSPGKLALQSRRWLEGGDLRRLQGYDEGEFIVMEEGAQFLASAVGWDASKERLLDVCAGHGQKSLAMIDEALAKGVPSQQILENFVASDIRGNKLMALREEAQRLGLEAPPCIALDWAKPAQVLENSELLGKFGRVLVDAPCSGTGTLRRRPEISRRLTPEDITRLAQCTRNILLGLKEVLEPNSRVIFVVCSVLREEAEDLVDSLSEFYTEAPFDAPEVRARFGEVSRFRLGPIGTGSDGYFAACLVPRAI